MNSWKNQTGTKKHSTGTTKSFMNKSTLWKLSSGTSKETCHDASCKRNWTNSSQIERNQKKTNSVPKERTGTGDDGRPAKNAEHRPQVKTSIDSLDSHDAKGERVLSRRGRRRADKTFAPYRVQTLSGVQSDMDHTLNEEMARTDLDSLHANLKANLDGVERLNQIRTNIGDHARILKQSELSMTARSDQIKFARILTRSTWILMPTYIGAVIQIIQRESWDSLARILKGSFSYKATFCK